MDELTAKELEQLRDTWRRVTAKEPPPPRLPSWDDFDADDNRWLNR